MGIAPHTQYTCHSCSPNSVCLYVLYRRSSTCDNAIASLSSALNKVAACIWRGSSGTQAHRVISSMDNLIAKQTRILRKIEIARLTAFSPVLQLSDSSQYRSIVAVGSPLQYRWLRTHRKGPARCPLDCYLL